MDEFLASLQAAQPVAFSAGDLVEGLGFLTEVQRRAVLFGLEQQLPVNLVVEMTHRLASEMQLTKLARAIVAQQPRHIRLNYLFWGELEGGVIAPLFGLDHAVREAFGGMSWDDLQRAYARMVWVDHGLDALHFKLIARAEGLLD